ncbi:restriction endonuclease subunit S [Rhizobium ruizarguesonis]|jgi:type I restriction enzyme S subunit|uniref:restriction endonuclease subunit S n=1 Tax=Rhizobium ruizarguesonis TaxID=2081791 RepID=UPI0010325910|nr:restriction endonuclease subunit S [Rhizobium ruizarguesonis]TCA62121.1 restriction endonuclease subunit S [Rhizobium leguminosarum bv. viciae]TAZ81363.1 restriction endonuclease subunit S [Rhizobium ruizarguesonis]TBA36642.1 restriction endonuclease subunit S [Rhizobium ruizarguesonis]TBA84228.1 restriction endonuclease subunit S [Rhizobium ruizarguesonis]TBB10351.1 restriction endonuclease subunit S [Rhizobium ruizarguesonis]
MTSTEKSAWTWLAADLLCKKITKGTTPPKSAISDTGSVPFLRVNNLIVGGSKALYGKLIYVDDHTSKTILKRSIAYPNDVLMNIVGPPLGKITILDDSFCEYNLNQAIIIFRGYSARIDSNFLYYYLASEVAQEWFEARAKKTSGQKNLTIELCKEIPIPCPPLSEQRRIVDILSTWDKAIETTERLLANAEVYKRALFQQLLTGKRRLKGFEGSERPKKHLRDVAKVIVSNVDKKTISDEMPVRLCNYTDVYERDFIVPAQDFMSATATPEQARKFRLRADDVIITKDSETADDIAKPTYVLETADNLICGYHLAIIRPGKDADGRYLKFFFELPRTRHYFGTRANGAIRYGLTIDGIEGAEIRLPPIEEQKRIAAVLVAAEEAISHFRREMHFLKTEKTSLMRQLLTGKKRGTV